MATHKYTYLTKQFTTSTYDAHNLCREIRRSKIRAALKHLNGYGNRVDIFFKKYLSDNDLIILDDIIAKHEGNSGTTPRNNR
jgi:hypothetical protein